MRPPAGVRRTGFTLIEVLVVVAIIALLVAVLLPSLKAAKEQAKRADCASNLHQIGVAVAMYANAHKDDLPLLYRTTSPFTTYYMRTTAEGTVNLGLVANARYANDPKLFYCAGQDQIESASLTYDGPDNTWYSDREYAVLSPPRPQVRCAYPARLIKIPVANQQIGADPQGEPMPAGKLTRWKYNKYASKIIYSDFTGVSQFSGGGVQEGFVSSPHDLKGFNCLFANGAVRWAHWALANKVRAITSEAPTPLEQFEYYRHLDRIR